MKNEISPEEFLVKLDALSDDQLISQQHLAALLSVSDQLFADKRMKGVFIPQTVNAVGVIRYRIGDVMQWLANGARVRPQLSANMEIVCADVGAYRPVLLPFALVADKVRPFFETLNDDVDEIVWLMPTAFQDRLEHRIAVAQMRGLEASLRKVAVQARKQPKKDA